ncbi:GMC family oxidoreductase [Kribbella sp. NPDC051620]|uniref:GMC family oxidoreductase n=1 Tax=Kribbella sp. NPDC051620 TaxID=3364120 RepID=UPI00379BFE42
MKYDDIVIGGGSSGAVIAARLSEDPNRQVLLIEAGPDYATLEATPDSIRNFHRPPLDHDWGLEAEMVPGRNFYYPRGRVIGGSSATNAVLALRGLPEDYDVWAAMGNDEWNWKSLLPEFQRIEDDPTKDQSYHGSGGPIPIWRRSEDELTPSQAAFLNAITDLGFPRTDDHNAPDATGAGPGPANVKDGVRISAALAYLNDARSRPNLTIRGGLLANRVLIEDGRAVGVEVRDQVGNAERIYAGRTTVCAGSIGSPAILLRSGIGDQDELAELGIPVAQHLPGVGRNLIEHAHIGLNLAAVEGPGDGTKPMWQVVLQWTAPGSSHRNDMQCLMLHAVAQPAHRLMMNLMLPRSRGTVRLASADAAVAPKIALNLATDPEDVSRLVAGLEVLTKLAQSPRLAPHHSGSVYLDTGVEIPVGEIAEYFADRATAEKYIADSVTHYVHPVGTARMGPASSPHAVVDQHCRVHGIAALRVADASVMPDIPRANTNLTCLVIGERVAQWIRAEDRVAVGS